MGMYGRQVRVNGLVCGLILREYGNTGEYNLVFERENATLEQLEAVDWTRPEMTYLGEYIGTKLPEGYGFELKNIVYGHNDKTWRVHIKMGAQYYGDVTGYQEQVAQLQTAAAENEATIADQAALIEAQNETITEQSAEIEALKEAGTAAELEEGLDAAYQEGVDSVE